MERSSITLLILALVVLPVAGFAQYSTAVGFRLGGTSGITIKHNYAPSKSFEGILGLWNDGMSFTGLIEHHPQAFDVPGLHWYYGGGGHIAIFSDDYRYRGLGRNDDRLNDGELGLGIDGVIGLEYVIPETPLAISAGLKPFIEFNTEGGIYASPDPGLGMKLTF